jgi:predicted DNA-binding ribbon-helix-helix protein
MTSTVAKRSIVIAGHKISISLGLKAIAENRRRTLSALVAEIDQNRGNLSSAIRVFGFGPLSTQRPEASANGFGPGVATSAFAQRDPQSS